MGARPYALTGHGRRGKSKRSKGNRANRDERASGLEEPNDATAALTKRQTTANGGMQAT